MIDISHLPEIIQEKVRTGSFTPQDLLYLRHYAKSQVKIVGKVVIDAENEVSKFSTKKVEAYDTLCEHIFITLKEQESKFISFLETNHPDKEIRYQYIHQIYFEDGTNRPYYKMQIVLKEDYSEYEKICTIFIGELPAFKVYNGYAETKARFQNLSIEYDDRVHYFEHFAPFENSCIIKYITGQWHWREYPELENKFFCDALIALYERYYKPKLTSNE